MCLTVLLRRQRRREARREMKNDSSYRGFLDSVQASILRTSLVPSFYPLVILQLTVIIEGPLFQLYISEDNKNNCRTSMPLGRLVTQKSHNTMVDLYRLGLKYAYGQF